MEEKKTYGWLKHLDFMILDIVYIEAAFLLATVIRQPSFFVYRQLNLYAHLNIWLVILDICYVVLSSAYKNILKRSAAAEVQSVIIHNVIVWGLGLGYLYVTKQAFFFSRTVYLVSVVLSVIFMTFGRICWKIFIRRRLWKGKNLPYVLVITTKEYAGDIIKSFDRRMYNGINLKGLAIIDADMTGEKIGRMPVVCGKNDLLTYIQDQVVDEVMIHLPQKSKKVSKMIRSLLQMGIVVHIGLDYMDDRLPNRVVERIGGYTYLTTRVNTVSPVQGALKRVIDVIAGLVGCAVTGILFIFVAPLIVSASPGKVFYTQTRVGKNGRRFKMYKFRSMYPDADERKKELLKQNEMKGEMFKIDHDPRIIRKEKGIGKNIGDFIRRTSIDEFPQFFNILKGDMSLVGTRPPTEDEYENYALRHMIRLSMKPGLTGLWQVSGRSQIRDFEKVVKLDAEYIENWSLRLDFDIILKTFKAVAKRRGAA